jgi:hypothetical protein
MRAMAAPPDPSTSSSPSTEAERDYRRVCDEVARHEAVAAAEDVLTASWIGELERLRIGLLRVADQHVLGRVQDVRAGRGHTGISSERARRLAEVIVMREIEPDELAPLLRDVSDALDAARLAAARRIRHRAEDLERLRASWEKAYGKGRA